MIRGAGEIERREFGRRWSRVHGWICIDGRPRVPCIVRNFSEGGALLQHEPHISPPTLFRLVIDAAKFEIGCEVRHRQPGSAGVRFMNEDAMQRIIARSSIETAMKLAEDACEDA